MTNVTDITFSLYQQQRIAHWDNVAQLSDTQANWGNYYHQRLTQIYQFLIAPGLRIIELGCAKGDLLAALKPSRGIGIDFSSEMIKQAIQRHPNLEFISIRPGINLRLKTEQL
jgi:ubiquinone/menaquinone biosynthesis C-methylase UbiE